MAWDRIAPGIWIAQAHIKRGDQRWYVIVRRKDHADGRQRYFRGGPDRATALAVATQLSRRFGAAGSSQAMVDQILQAYQQAHVRTLRRDTEKLWNGYIRNYLGPHFFGKVATEITKADLFDFGVAILGPLEGEAQQKRFATVKNSLTVLRAALRWYWRENSVALREYACPALHVSEAMQRIRKRFSISRRRRRPAYTPDQARVLMAVAAEMDQTVHDLFAVAIGTGMRLSEILGLRWGNIDELRSMIVPAEDGELRRMGRDGKPALYKSEREEPIAMPRGLLELFHRRRLLRTSDEWVFAGKGGQPFIQSNLSIRIRKVRRAAVAKGVPFDRTFHSTRHTFASIAHEAGRSFEWIKNQVGHHSSAFTADQYVHLTGDAHDMDPFDFSHRSQTAHDADTEAPDADTQKRLN